VAEARVAGAKTRRGPRWWRSRVSYTAVARVAAQDIGGARGAWLPLTANGKPFVASAVQTMLAR
jgi:hypothetical protein